MVFSKYQIQDTKYWMNSTYYEFINHRESKPMGIIVKAKKNSQTSRCIITRMVMVFVFVSVVTSCGFAKRNNQPQIELSKLHLKEDIISFTFNKIPKIYSGLVKLDSEIVIVDKELERLKEIEAEFPKQKKIILTERNHWKKVKKDLLSSLSKLEKEVENIYVTHLVNKEKGTDLINKNTKPLMETINKTLEASSPHTKRLIVTEKKSFLAGLKDKFLG